MRRHHAAAGQHERVIIRTSLPPNLPQIVADARSVRQIALNLLSNSIKFTGAGGQVIVATAVNDDHEIVLRVRDTGPGMSERNCRPRRCRAVPSDRLQAAPAVPGSAYRSARRSPRPTMRDSASPARSTTARRSRFAFRRRACWRNNEQNRLRVRIRSAPWGSTEEAVMRRLSSCVVFLVSAIAPPARTAEPVDLLLALFAAERLAQRRCAKIPIATRRLCRCGRQFSACRRHPVRPQRPYRGIACGVVVPRRLAEGRDRLRMCRSTGRRPHRHSATGCWNRLARSPIAPRSAAASTSRSHSWHARRFRLNGAPSTSPATAPIMPAASRRRPRRGAGAWRHHQRSRLDPERDPVAVEPRHTHRPAAWQLLSDNVWWPRRLRAGGEGFQFFGQAIIKKLIAEIADATPPR